MGGSRGSGSATRQPDRRKLIAVLYADMVGYSRLIGLDDMGTLERLRRLRKEVIDPAIEEHGGRVIQTGGDSLLIVFDSVDGAVQCAVQVQRQVRDLEAEPSPDRAMRFRIGINIGDAIPMEQIFMETRSMWPSDFRLSVGRVVSVLRARYAIMSGTGSIWPSKSLGYSG
jgi:hypothetical protein